MHAIWLRLPIVLCCILAGCMLASSFVSPLAAEANADASSAANPAESMSSSPAAAPKVTDEKLSKPTPEQVEEAKLAKEAAKRAATAVKDTEAFARKATDEMNKALLAKATARQAENEAKAAKDAPMAAQAAERAAKALQAAEQATAAAQDAAKAAESAARAVPNTVPLAGKAEAAQNFVRVAKKAAEQTVRETAAAKIAAGSAEAAAKTAADSAEAAAKALAKKPAPPPSPALANLDEKLTALDNAVYLLSDSIPTSIKRNACTAVGGTWEHGNDTCLPQRPFADNTLLIVGAAFIAVILLLIWLGYRQIWARFRGLGEIVVNSKNATDTSINDTKQDLKSAIASLATSAGLKELREDISTLGTDVSALKDLLGAPDQTILRSFKRALFGDMAWNEDHSWTNLLDECRVKVNLLTDLERALEPARSDAAALPAQLPRFAADLGRLWQEVRRVWPDFSDVSKTEVLIRLFSEVGGGSPEEALVRLRADRHATEKIAQQRDHLIAEISGGTLEDAVARLSEERHRAAQTNDQLGALESALDRYDDEAPGILDDGYEGAVSALISGHRLSLTLPATERRLEELNRDAEQQKARADGLAGILGTIGRRLMLPLDLALLDAARADGLERLADEVSAMDYGIVAARLGVSGAENHWDEAIAILRGSEYTSLLDLIKADELGGHLRLLETRLAEVARQPDELWTKVILPGLNERSIDSLIRGQLVLAAYFADDVAIAPLRRVLEDVATHVRTIFTKAGAEMIAPTPLVPLPEGVRIQPGLTPPMLRDVAGIKAHVKAVIKERGEREAGRLVVDLVSLGCRREREPVRVPTVWVINPSDWDG